MFNPENIKSLYRAMGEPYPASLDLPSKQGLQKARNNLHWTEREREGVMLKIETEFICPVCDGHKIDSVSKEPCEFCLGNGYWIEVSFK